MHHPLYRHVWPPALLCVILLSCWPTLAQQRPQAWALPAGAVGGPVAVTGQPPAELHLPRINPVNFNYNMTDGKGFMWDIQAYGTVGQGTNNLFSGGVYFQVSGNNVRTRDGRAWANNTRDEIEIGPYPRNGLNCYRRIRVYKDQGLARWLEILENPRPAPVTVPVQLVSNINYGIAQVAGSSGQQGFNDKDWAYLIQTASGNNSVPVLMHILCGPRSKVRPNVRIQGNRVYIQYRLTVPANGAVILCHFQSQANNMEDHQRTLKSFRAHRLLADLPAAARKAIINFSSTAFIEGVDLERLDSSDNVVLRNGDPIRGTITNESYTMDTYIGPLTIPAEKVIGMAATGSDGEILRALLVDGQVVSGRIAGDAKISITRPNGSVLRIPFGDIAQWSYRLDKSRPEDPPFSGPIVTLRTGDRLAFEGDTLDARFLTRHGAITLRPEELFAVRLDNPAHGVHRVLFANGTQLAGMLDPEILTAKLRLGPQLSVPRNMIAELQFRQEEQTDRNCDHALLTNGDELYGQLADQQLHLTMSYGTDVIQPKTVEKIVFDLDHSGRLIVTMWDGSVERSVLQKDQLTFALTPETSLNVYVGHFVELVRSNVHPDEETLREIERLVGQLGAESYEDRQAATEALQKMPKGIAPFLAKYLETGDPEVQQRIREILNRFGWRQSAGDDIEEQGAIQVLMGGTGPAGDRHV